jgi:hypothetical protein
VSAANRIRVCGDACHLRKTSELPERAALAAKRLERFNSVIEILFQDENFITLLRAESMLTLPTFLASTSKGGD